MCVGWNAQRKDNHISQVAASQKSYVKQNTLELKMAEIMDAGLDVEKIAEIMDACVRGRMESDTFSQTAVTSGFE